jgi:hypothetical protein
MHTLVEMYHITRKEFERNLVGLTEEDAGKCIEPMNCISWIIGHVANQQHAFFVDWPQGRESDIRFSQYGTGRSPSKPALADAMSLWRIACDEADIWLDAATDRILKEVFHPSKRGPAENAGTLLVRSTFHIWCHLGEISSIRQILGHRPPEFVHMHGWTYRGTET